MKNISCNRIISEFSEDRADNFLAEAQATINQLNSSEKNQHLKEVLDRIKTS